MKILHLVVGPIETNCYIPFDEETKRCAVIDPGDEPGRIEDAISQNGLTPEAILLTHGHYDHICGVNGLKQKYPGIRILIAAAEKPMIEDPRLNSPFGPEGGYEIRPTEYVADGDKIYAAGFLFDAIGTPGHTAGSMCYEMPAFNLMFSGDTIFCASHGRTDLPTGDDGAMARSLAKILDSSRPDDELILPGHGSSTTAGQERRVWGLAR